jgi:hypothetical protein
MLVNYNSQNTVRVFQYRPSRYNLLKIEVNYDTDKIVYLYEFQFKSVWYECPSFEEGIAGHAGGFGDESVFGYVKRRIEMDSIMDKEQQHNVAKIVVNNEIVWTEKDGFTEEWTKELMIFNLKTVA